MVVLLILKDQYNWYIPDKGNQRKEVNKILMWMISLCILSYFQIVKRIVPIS